MDNLRGSERRRVTVLFCDIVDSTGLSERCDPEDLSDVLLEFQVISSRCVQDAGGNVINFIGDGIRAEFGYPLASENEAEAAVRAGLALLAAIEGLDERSIAALGEPLRVRIGVHTGLAVIGKAGPGHVHDATEIVGDTPNIAFRLQEMVGPNSLVISDDTRRLLRADFPLRPLGSRPLKGLSRRIEAFQVVGAPAEDDNAGGVRRRNAAPLVGRTAELEQLLQEWELAKGGCGRTVEITGEPGIGKSRLAFELVGRTGLRDDAILLQASAQHQNTPLYPIIRRLEHRIGIRKDESLEANAARLQEFLAAMHSVDEQQYLVVARLLGLQIAALAALQAVPDAQDLRRRTRDVVVQLLTHNPPGAAGLILMEDFHWADPSTAEIVERIAEQIAHAPVLLVVASRTETLRGDRTKMRSFPLQRLADGDCREIAASVGRERQLPHQLLEQVVTRADGVPLFAEELAAAALETGHVEPSAGPLGEGHGVPSALYDSLMLRLERLGEARAIAQLGSVIGRSFSHQLLAAVVATEQRATLATSLARLLESGLIKLEEDEDEKVYSFKHALVRDVAYQSLLKRHRRELHGRVADEIEIHRPEIASREPDYLAQHLSEAGRITRAVHMWIEAAKQSAARSANLEAIAQLRRALEEIKQLPAGIGRDNLELNAHVALIGPTIALQGFAATAVADISGRAIELCRAMDDDLRIFPAMYARWSYLRVGGNVRDASALAQDFLTLAEQRGTRTDRMVGHRLLGTSLLDGNTPKAREHLELATKLYDAAADRMTAGIYGTEVQVTCLSNLCIVTWLLGRVTQAVAQGQEALALASKLGHAHTLGYAFAHVCSMHTLERDAATVKIMARQALAGAIERELRLWISVARAYLGWAEVEAGNFAEGIAKLEEQSGFLHSAQLRYWLPTYLCWLGEAYVRADKPMQAKLRIDEAHEVMGRGGDYWYATECLRIEGRLLAHPEVNDAGGAEKCFEQALALARARGQRGFALRAATALAAHVASKGRPEGPCELLEEELRFFADAPDRGDRADARALLRSLKGATEQ
jgi:class 3 adenylate cyclase/tetratricopeptide (TPR) repeat protein